MMVNESEWTEVFYVDAQGNEPVREFLAELDRKTNARFAWSIAQLRLRNVHARPPLVKHLEGEIWELREESQTNIYRLLYAFISDRRILFLHGFQTKTQITPSREIDTAVRRLQDFLEREGGETA